MKEIGKFIAALSILTGTIIGVGIFSLPYINQQVGFWVMLAYLIAISLVVLTIKYVFVFVALRTPNFLRLPGFSKTYLGDTGKYFAIFASIVGGIGTLLAYIIIGGGFLFSLLSPYFGGNSFIYVIIYFAVGAVYIYFGSKVVSRIDLWAMLLFFLSLGLLFIKGGEVFNLNNIAFFPKNVNDLFLPYGAFLFALWGVSMIPEIEETVDSDEKKLRKIVLISVIISVLCYLAFFVVICGISGEQTSTDAITGLKNILGSRALSVMFLAGILATFTSFITIGLNLKKVLWYDIKISHNAAWVITCFTPFLMFLLGFKDFIKIIGFVGGVALAIEGILIFLMYKKIQQGKKKLLIYSFILILLAGIVYEIIYFIK